ncbi:hypothetical protein CBFG_03058 [Clostridiales bacterium 1_7_47FAA]|nr:hypothetical protein CBFG_03058 [Clostridiales bacterium 1_7_47FAA]
MALFLVLYHCRLPPVLSGCVRPVVSGLPGAVLHNWRCLVHLVLPCNWRCLAHLMPPVARCRIAGGIRTYHSVAYFCGDFLDDMTLGEKNLDFCKE